MRKSVADLNGFAFPLKTRGAHSVDSAPQGDDASIIVEKNYTEHIERVLLRLKRVDGEWKIAAIQGLDKKAPKIKYGTPVVPDPPEKKPR